MFCDKYCPILQENLPLQGKVIDPCAVGCADSTVRSRKHVVQKQRTSSAPLERRLHVYDCLNSWQERIDG